MNASRKIGIPMMAAGLGILLASGVATAAYAEDGSSDSGWSGKPSTRIVGGQQASDGEFLFMAELQTPDGEQFCGGSLISPTTVLTAAHCVAGSSSAAIKVGVGRTVLSDRSQGVERSVVGIDVHPQYASNSAYDAAILHLDQPVLGIRPVRLPTGNADSLFRPGQMATVIGWGNTDPVQPYMPDRLRKVDVPIVSAGECSISYGKSLDSAAQFCAGTTGKDSCQGDSGGPALRVAGETVYQIGIVSWGDGCAQTGAPGVYTALNDATMFWNAAAGGGS